MTLRRRLDRLEARNTPAAPVEVEHWIFAPGPDGLCGLWRMPDGLTLDRAPGESAAGFRTRAEAALARRAL